MSDPIQHPISKLGFFLEYTSPWLIELSEAAATLEQARSKPHVLTDHDVSETRRVYTEQAEDLTLFEDTSARWAAQANLTAEQRAGLATLGSNLVQLRHLNTSILELTDYLETRTIERVLATPDIELGLSEFLKHFSGQRPDTTN
ncbi:hypothetical protein GU243_23740 (plasmid) [Pseudarthrobacter psychrotolerans]|uniref:Uncharacterized protein n=1 Tax=Pseudarthrobacter psychrotolerans TaxID=2697569 RepID=A0A6P1NW10_9MICC|nr:hypothetical protein [Pseudarthrobacter psychrotolerans]QHK22580.1 hypothetical protein GU243_23740 [Pseudarthrobacter psychrotolerans]